MPAGVRNAAKLFWETARLEADEVQRGELESMARSSAGRSTRRHRLHWGTPRPFCERFVRGDHRALVLVAPADQFEQQIGMAVRVGVGVLLCKRCALSGSPASMRIPG
jgi:hypothetical protein